MGLGHIGGIGRHGSRDGLPDPLKIGVFRDLLAQGVPSRLAALRAGLGPDEFATLLQSGEIEPRGWNQVDAGDGVDPAQTPFPDAGDGPGSDPASQNAHTRSTYDPSPASPNAPGSPSAGAFASDTAPPRFDAGLIPNIVNRLLNGGQSASYSAQAPANPMIERLFGGGATRGDGSQTLNFVAQRVVAGPEATRGETANMLAAAGRGESAYGARLDGAAQARAAQATTPTSERGLPPGQPPQASVIAGQQTAAQTQQVERGPGEALLAQNFRQGEAPPAVAREGGSTLQAGDRNQAVQQQPAQTAPTLPGRADAPPAQAAAQLAGTTVAANVLGTALPSQVAPPALAAAQPPGTDSAAAQARETSVLQPAGHTAAGNLRRDLRPGSQALHKPVGWMLALIPGIRHRRLASEHDRASAQWLFWTLTVIAYGALVLAIVALVSEENGNLIRASGGLSYGVYALIVAGMAAVASWVVSRRLTREG